MKRVLVTGATGYLGGALIHYLRRRGFRTVALGRDSERCRLLQRQGFNTLRGDLAVGLGSTEAARIGALEGVVHCAALSAPWGRFDDFYAANVIGTRHALELADTLGARRFVNISSPTVYFEFRDRLGVTETAPLPRPINLYARTKREAERLVWAQRPVGAVNLRPRGIYGRGETTLLPRLLAAARAGALPLLRGGVAQIDLTHVSDVVAAIEAALTAGEEVEGHTFNISGGESLAVKHIVERVCTVHAVPLRWRRMAWRPALAAARLVELSSRVTGREPRVTPYSLGLFAFRQSLDIARAGRMLNWRPAIDFETGLELSLGSREAP